MLDSVPKQRILVRYTGKTALMNTPDVERPPVDTEVVYLCTYYMLSSCRDVVDSLCRDDVHPYHVIKAYIFKRLDSKAF